MLENRIEVKDGGIFLVSITCNCGNIKMIDRLTKEKYFKHQVTLGGEEIMLRCGECGRNYRLKPQKNHIHIETTTL